MRYYYEKSSVYSSMYGDTYTCDHPIYNKCTLILYLHPKLKEFFDDRSGKYMDGLYPTVTIRQTM